MAWQGRSLIFRQFWVVSGTRCAGHVQDATGTHPNFQAVCGHSVQAMSRTHPGHGWDVTQFSGNFWDSVCRPCPGCIMAKAGTEPNFQAILGSFMDTVCRPCPRYDRDASGLLGIFRQFSGTRCAGNVRDTSDP
ncbi:Hypothetical predicted protein [Olea europaea subsp. europaea]|uniref:Uncharacterized protein n=1 Tax=Olea europaea subsp. europaea TaxID=158383 RepID=A0A8S0S394_OLEEU|nr:Hypothetical predicted protein [Olea europaea subsp. europaea]